jgi:hypothetical protein
MKRMKTERKRTMLGMKKERKKRRKKINGNK